MMLERQLQARIEARLQQMAAVALLGPRQVGKTTLAFQLAEKLPSVYLDMEDPADTEKLADAAYYCKQHQGKLIIIDEVQRRPDLFKVLRSQIDKNRRAGFREAQFLLLGSASNELLKQSSESLAGRVSYQELSPFNLIEVGADRLNDLWVLGGFPNAFIDTDFDFVWRQNFIRTYLERDIPALGPRIPAETLRRFWTMLGHHQGQPFNAAQIGGSLGVSGQTASRYLDLMVDLMLVRRLPPWYVNTGKRLVKSPKTYIRDSGILHALLGIDSLETLLGHPVAGASWEGMVIENILSVLPGHIDAYYYRTQTGVEIDLLLTSGKTLWAIEVKRSTAPKLGKGFRIACEDIQPAAKWLVYPGEASYRLPGDIQVVSLQQIMDEVITGFV